MTATSLRLQFNPQIRLELHATITSDAGLLAFRELDDALDLTPIASDYLHTGRNIRHHLGCMSRFHLSRRQRARYRRHPERPGVGCLCRNIVDSLDRSHNQGVPGGPV